MKKRKITRLSKFHEMPKPAAHLKAAAREEWNRVAPRLFSMGRLERQEGLGLELYCRAYANLADLTKELSQCDPTERDKIELLRSAQKQQLKHCRESALGFGFRLDSNGRMNLAKPVSLTAAANILGARRERRENRIRARFHVDSLPEWLQVPTYFSETECKEWARVAPALYAKNRLRSEDDLLKLVGYCNAFGNWRRLSGVLNKFRREVDSTKPEHKPTLDSLSKDAERELASCKKLAWELGSSFEISRGLNTKTISSRKKRP